MTFDFALIDQLKHASNIAVLTGAGISQESGIPTFRESQTGLWENYSPLELATPEAFRKNPLLVWDWYRWRREIVLNSAPNLAHLSLVEMETLFPQFSIITQNVDGFHQTAGSQNVIELHGNIHRAKCQQEHFTAVDWEMDINFPPTCPQCEAMLRPDIVWFGESIPDNAMQDALRACLDADALIIIGTSGLVEPAASLPFMALNNGALLVEVNISHTTLYGYAQYSLLGKAACILPQLLDEIRP